MLGGWWHKARCPIGIDLGEHSVKAVQLHTLRSHLRVRAAASAAMPHDTPPAHEGYHQAVQDTLARLLEQGAFAGRRVVVGLPASVVQFKNLRLPKMPPGELPAAVEWEARQHLEPDQQPVEIQFFDAGEVRQGQEVRQEVILMTASSPFIEAHLQMLSRLGLEPVALEVAPSALMRSARATAGPEGDELRVAIDVGYAFSKVLIGRGQRVLFFKLIDIAGRHWDEAVAQQLKLPRHEAGEVRRRLGREAAQDPAEADQAPRSRSQEEAQQAVQDAVRPLLHELAREASLCLRYYGVTFRGQRPRQIALTGGESRQPGLAQALAQQMGVEVRTGAQALTVDLSDAPTQALREHPAAWAVAMGLSLRDALDQAKRRAA